MAKKQPQAKLKQSQPSGFFKGMVSDVDPRLQPKSTYRDARNIKLINTSGNSLTIVTQTDGEIPLSHEKYLSPRNS